ncbi:hypothetical protein K9N68_24785 [Kovacikia minuta CCNUW1]|uniref:hypothetical protein n=1 Tax=Kovacikia minuta TaxID=2931930 RepID=UPI001CC996B3|nr:hypothetical protein [Kovacikia minuta]UBF24846.1 hypothetical protein K9N68_24785 [Kovacikia minuta CCNUW1]
MNVFRGPVTFKAAFSGIGFDPIEFFPSYEKVSKAVIESSPNKGTLLKIEITDASTFDEAIRKAKEFALCTAKLLTFKFAVFQEFQLIEDDLTEEKLLPDGNTAVIHHCIVGVGIGVNTTSWTTLNFRQSVEVKKLLQKTYHFSLFYYDLFYSALGLTDPLAKFMALYSLLLTLCHDKQENVDIFILKVQPTVSTNPPYRARKSGVPETIYTRLRNQIGHVRPGTTVEATREEMEANLGELLKISKALISKQP